MEDKDSLEGEDKDEVFQKMKFPKILNLVIKCSFMVVRDVCFLTV